MSNSLNYADLKRKAVSARSFRVNQTSRSGTKFDSGSNFQIQLPSAARQYADLGNVVLQQNLRILILPAPRLSGSLVLPVTGNLGLLLLCLVAPSQFAAAAWICSRDG